MEFIDYLKKISTICDFKDTLVDKLKIPSTKRICLIGKGRNHDESKFDENSKRIQAFINDTLNQSKSQSGNSEAWAQNFVAREAYQPVRNCTQIDRTLSENIIKIIFDKLLASENFGFKFKSWNIGGELKLLEAAQLIPTEMLKQIKSECGGLQTLLRNNNQIFEVMKGIVKIKPPFTVSE